MFDKDMREMRRAAIRKDHQRRKQQAAERREICDACPHKIALICAKCGCLIATKTNRPGASCPVKKW